MVEQYALVKPRISSTVLNNTRQNVTRS